ncbi:MAG: hypothetical protein R3F62_06465 [Planctomycetota bacterium]
MSSRPAQSVVCPECLKCFLPQARILGRMGRCPQCTHRFRFEPSDVQSHRRGLDLPRGPLACAISGLIGVCIATGLLATGHGSHGALTYLVACWALASYGVLTLVLQRQERALRERHTTPTPSPALVSGVVSGVGEL